MNYPFLNASMLGDVKSHVSQIVTWKSSPGNKDDAFRVELLTWPRRHKFSLFSDDQDEAEGWTRRTQIETSTTMNYGWMGKLGSCIVKIMINKMQLTFVEIRKAIFLVFPLRFTDVHYSQSKREASANVFLLRAWPAISEREYRGSRPMAA